MASSRLRLKNKTAIVTGGGTKSALAGTGQAIAILYAREGAKVLLMDIDEANALKTQETIRKEGGEASVFVGDVTRHEDCRAMVNAAVSRYGCLNILFNNVGISRPGTAVDVKEEDWDTVLDVNLKSVMLTSRHAIPMMIEGGGGAIVNVSSIDGLRAGWSRNISYAAAKAGVIGMTRNMAIQHGRDNIRVNCIAPGHLNASLTSGLSESHREMRRRANALGTEGTAWDVAWAAVFLASDESRWITGVVLPVDAGTLAAHPLSIMPRDDTGILPDPDIDLHFPP